MGSGRAVAQSLDVNGTPSKRIVQRNEVLSYMYMRTCTVYISRVKLMVSLKGPEGVYPRGEGSRGRRRHQILDNTYRFLPAKSYCKG